MKINLGCGENIKKGWVNVDKKLLKGVDIQHDLNVFPYPFKDNSADLILLDNVLEHLDSVIDVMHECHRIIKPIGTIRIVFPYHKHPVAWSDPTHKRALTKEVFEFLHIGNNPKLYKNNPFGSLRFYGYRYKFGLTPVGKKLPFAVFLSHFCDFMILDVEIELSNKVIYGHDDFMRPLFNPEELKRRRMC